MPDPSDLERDASRALLDYLDDAGDSLAGRELNGGLARRVRELETANAALESELAERRRVEAGLRRIIDRTPGVAYTYTAAVPLRLTSMSGNTQRVLGLSASELMGDAEAWASRVHPEDLERAIQNATRVLRDGSVTNEYRYWHTDGSYHWICNSASLIQSEDGSPVEVAGYSLDVTQSRHDEHVRQERERLRAVNEALIAAQEAERKRISRGLHDGIGQRLALLILEIAEIERKPGPASRIPTRLSTLRAIVADITDDIRRLAAQLHPCRLEQIGLEQALRDECACLTERAGIAVRFSCAGMPEPLEPRIALCLYRVAQESLQNMVRHSQAQSGAMRLEPSRGGLLLTVTDAGTGFDPAVASKGFGFFSMRERVTLLGGAFSLVSAPGCGTRVEAWLPLSLNKENTFETDSHPAGR